MLTAGLVKKLADARKFFDDGLIFGDFAIEDAQRVGNGTALAIDAHFVFDRLKRVAQSFVVFGAITGTADGVQFEYPVLDAKAIEQCGEQFENLRVARRGFAARAGWADDLCADLIELA